MLRRVAFVLIACLLLVASMRRVEAATSDWLVVSDVHFDPFAYPHIVQRLAETPPNRWRAVFLSQGQQPFSNYGSDSNFALLESALDAMRNQVAQPPVVIITGDFLAHNFREKFDRTVRDHDDAHYNAFVKATIAFLAIEFRTAFPRARLIPVVGNNDNGCADYQTTPGSPFLAAMASAWGASVGAPDPNAFAAQFATGGYYTVPLPAGNAQAVVLNDVFWSTQYRNACGQKSAAPGADELTWLAATTKSLGASNVWVIAHIPPGVDAYSTLHGNPDTPVLFLTPHFNDAMIDALLRGPVHVVFSLAGHTHMNAYRMIGPDPSRPYVPMVLVPSISPIFNNNPAFTVLRVDDETATVDDLQVFVLDDLAALAKNGRGGARWQREYDFDSTYGHGPIDAPHFAAIQQSIFSDERVRRRFESYFDSGSGRAPMTDATWHAYWCANVALTVTEYSACASPQIQRQLPPHPPAPPLPSPTPLPSPSASP
ncbi:MAG TPA: hypothetical protein VFN49_05740 [Candidatus Aquilonibacter sp.]|nr:hypothetical protein [Candidatus Aquilonibacter sp.]